MSSAENLLHTYAFLYVPPEHPVGTTRDSCSGVEIYLTNSETRENIEIFHLIHTITSQVESRTAPYIYQTDTALPTMPREANNPWAISLITLSWIVTRIGRPPRVGQSTAAALSRWTWRNSMISSATGTDITSGRFPF